VPEIASAICAPAWAIAAAMILASALTVGSR
jgi:hypothetical protein